jgi:hypothetical protein
MAHTAAAFKLEADAERRKGDLTGHETLRFVEGNDG